jgi:catechol 2,3-dioxygenase-like lactoylglutathione lyase family enzyme
MPQQLMMVTLVVDDYDTAINFYTQKMNFDLLEDTALSPVKRWVVVAPKNTTGCRLLLAKAASAEQEKHIGNQTGGRVFLFLHTDDLSRDYALYQENGLFCEREPSVEPYGRVAVFKDLYGNLWDLIEPVHVK